MAEEHGVMGLFIFVILIIGVGIPLTHSHKSNSFERLRERYRLKQFNRTNSNHSSIYTSIPSTSSTDIRSENEWLLESDKDTKKVLNDERTNVLSDFFLSSSNNIEALA